MQLAELVRSYLLERECCAKYAESLRAVERSFSAALGHPATIADFADDPVNSWLASLRGSSQTRANKRRLLLTLWRDAFDRRLVDRLPGRIRKIKRADVVPECWTLEQVRKVQAACDELRGNFRRLKVSRALYMRALVDAKYDSCLRLGDLLSIEREWIWPGGYLSLVQNKTGKTQRVRLRDSTLKRIEELQAALPGHRLVWPPFAQRKRFYQLFKKIVAAAGVRGSAKWLRRTSASYFERENPGMAWRHLGHSRPGVDRQFYLDPNVAYPDRPLPPEP